MSTPLNSPLSDHGAFLDAFEASTINVEYFNHAAHVRAAWILLHDNSLTTAIDRYCSALKRFTASIDQAGKYHETITWFFILLIHQRMAIRPEDDWSVFCAHNPDILTDAKRLLSDNYSSDIIGSDLARRCFIMPGGLELASVQSQSAYDRMAS